MFWGEINVKDFEIEEIEEKENFVISFIGSLLAGLFVYFMLESRR